MDAKKCDRCGKFYVPGQSEFSKITVSVAYLFDERNKTHDVCPACMKEYKSWFAAPEASVEHGKEVK